MDRTLVPHTLSLLLITAASGGCEGPRKDSPPGPSPAIASAALAPSPSAVTSVAPPAPTEEAEPTEIAAQHVLIAYRGAKNVPRTVRRSKAEARKLAEEIVTKARGGAEFAKLAEAYSDDPGTRTNLGNLGKFPKDKMVPEFSGPAFKLGEGEISDVVETPFGFHVIKRNQ
ncbi:MAG: peptidyl-prolyl cis-trans isomerase [Polyangiaceae bacterium]|nr:peptidyl-prolyl cis-trans isomerase [Polyangiaceae bacterium]